MTSKIEECVINKKDVCPHSVINGHMCSHCKVPDKRSNGHAESDKTENNKQGE